jgi:hypothetical protein
MRSVILSAPKRAPILRLALDRMRHVGMPEPVVVMGDDFPSEMPFHKREVAVTEMHKNVWKNALDAGEPVAIYEDDAYFLRKHEVAPPPEGVLFFFGVTYASFKEYVLGGLSSLNGSYGVHAYIVTPSSARILLDSTQIVVDHKTNRSMIDGVLKGVVPTPYACCQMPHVSNVAVRGSWDHRHSGNFRGRFIGSKELLEFDLQSLPVVQDAENELRNHERPRR